MAIDINKDISYQLSINVLKALGGNTDVSFESVEEVWDEINKIYDNAGDRLDIEALIMDIRNNGLYEFYPNENADAYAPVRVNVNVPQKYTDEYVEQLGREAFNEGKIEGEEIGYQKGFEEGSDDGYQDGYSEGLDDGAEEQKSLMVEATIRENGVFERSDGYRKVTVDVTIPTFETEQLSVELTENGDYNYTPSKDGYDSVSVSVNVPTSEPADLRILDIEVKENKSYEYLPTDYDGWNKVNLLVNVPTGGGGDSGKPKIYNGFKLGGSDNIHYTRLSEVDFSQYDWSSVYDLSGFFDKFYGDSTRGWNLSDFQNFIDNYNGKMLCMRGTFQKPAVSYGAITCIPPLGERTKDCVDMASLFSSQEKLRDASGISAWNTSSVVDISNMFSGCGQLTKIGYFNTENVRDMSYFVKNCTSLQEIPHLITSNVLNMEGMFSNCSRVKTIPQLDFSKVQNVAKMFCYCGLTSLPDINCVSLTDFSGGSTSSDSSWLYYTGSLESIGVIHCDNIDNLNYCFDPRNATNLTDFGGFRNLGKVPGLTNTNTDYGLYRAPSLSYQSVLNVLNELYDRASAGYSILTLKLHANHLALLSEDDIAIATNKGWTLV